MIGFDNCYNNKKVLITGHTGFKGSWLTQWMLMLGAEVVGISDIIPTEPALFNILHLENKIKHYFEDLRNPSEISAIINQEKPDFIFHLGAQPIVSLSYKDPLQTISTNVMGTAHVLNSLLNSDFNCNVIVVTSDKCYDNLEWIWGYKETDQLGGKDIYSGSKGAAELVAKSYYHSFFKKEDSKIQLATVRAGNIIGGGDWAQDRIVPDMIRAWSSGKKLSMRSPNSTRPWQHVLDPLSGYLMVGSKLQMDDQYNGESFNFGPRHEINKPVIDLVQDMAKLWGFENFDDCYEIIDNKTFKEASLLRLNCDKALLELKWNPVLFHEENIEFTGNWYHEYLKSSNNIISFTETQIEDYCSLALERGNSWVK